MNSKKQLKILEISPFSAGICGVSVRVLTESKLLVKERYDVSVFSSNILRGGDEIQTTENNEEILEGVKIKRFPAKFSFGKNTFFWNFKKEAMKLKPDVIFTHAYRQYYSTLALRVAKKLKIPCFLVTHAPFLEKKLRNRKENLAVFIYDNLFGKRLINEYTKIISITRWEIPYLLCLGCEENKIEYIPNGIPEEFFNLKIPKKSVRNKLLFLGRISPIKNLEVLIKAVFLLKNPKICLDIVGPAEEKYKSHLKELITSLNIENQINFLPPVYDLNKKIDLIDNYEIFILPSKREAMPQALIEVMSREKLVISSDTEGGKEIIKDSSNGFLFKNDNEEDLVKVLKNVFEMNHKEKQKIKINARKSVGQFSWKRLIKKLERLILSKNL